MFEIDLNTDPIFIRPELILNPPVPPEMHGLTPRSLMGRKRWDKVRKEAYAKNNYCCWACGVFQGDAPYRQWLEAHEIYDVDYAKGEMRLREIVALCHLCHQFVHYGRARALMRMGKMSPEKFSDIMAHGHKIMEEYKPKPWWDYEKMKMDMAIGRARLGWGDWKLIFEGKEYHSKFKDKGHWERFYRERAEKKDG